MLAKVELALVLKCVTSPDKTVAAACGTVYTAYHIGSVVVLSLNFIHTTLYSVLIEDGVVSECGRRYCKDLCTSFSDASSISARRRSTDSLLGVIPAPVRPSCLAAC